MSENKFEVFDDAREFVARTRPIFVERHDFSAKLFKNRETSEPSFSISAASRQMERVYPSQETSSKAPSVILKKQPQSMGRLSISATE